MKVIALAKGYYGGEVREIGDEFTVQNGEKLGGWMHPLETVSEKPKSKPAKPEAQATEKADEELM